MKRDKGKNNDIGKMDNKKLFKKDKGKVTTYFEEEENFEAIDEKFTRYFKKVMDVEKKVKCEICNGAMFINNPLNIKNLEKKIVIFYLNKNNKIQKGILTFSKDEDVIKNKIKIYEINYKESVEKKENEGKNIIIEGMCFKIIKENVKPKKNREDIRVIYNKKYQKIEKEENQKQTKKRQIAKSIEENKNKTKDRKIGIVKDEEEKKNIKIIRDKGEKSKEENKGGKPGKEKRRMEETKKTILKKKLVKT